MASSSAEAPASGFSSSADEVLYWKNRASVLEEEAKTAREELEEYQESSRELEAELETQLEQAESKMKEYRSLANRLQMENEQTKDKLEQCQREYHCQVRAATWSSLARLGC